MKGPRPTLVIVDDEPHVLGTLNDQFRKEYHVATFESASDALLVLESLNPSVVLTDQRMPDMSGVNFLRQVKDRRPDATRLLFTGYADIKAVIDAINEGHVFRYLTKPWEPEEMEATIRQAVEQHDLLVERRSLIAELTKSNRKLEESNTLKKAFIEVASHELNTPVAVILGMTDLWKMMPSVDGVGVQAAWLERVQGAGKRLAGTIERMLKLLRADQFDEPLSLQVTDLEPLTWQVVADIRPFLDARGQTAELRLESGLGSAEIDPAKISDILTNLIVNAIKFTPDGGTIVVIAESVGTDHVRFRVVDRGIGINQADCTHLFEPFFTGYDTLHHSSGDYQFCKKGIGLGLCLVKTFVELHGGSVDVMSSPNSGSTFGFTLPRQAARRKAVGKVVDLPGANDSWALR
ncbi:MAG: histidine kinase,Response regulator receiver domain proteinhistidine kinase [Planctomycetota bacterium]|nr:histidine kinase,Response regulator receiver domain proteinhistidine kinase [Planctomycetota bacterium]